MRGIRRCQGEYPKELVRQPFFSSVSSFDGFSRLYWRSKTINPVKKQADKQIGNDIIHAFHCTDVLIGHGTLLPNKIRVTPGKETLCGGYEMIKWG